MGNKQSHNESENENENHSDNRDKVKSKTPGRMLRRGSCSSSASDKDNESSAQKPSQYSSSASKPDGIYKLAKELMIRSQNQDQCEGICLDTFSKYVCHGSSDLGQALFRDFMKKGKSCKKKTSSSSHNNLSKEQFIAGSQKVVQLIGDDQLLTYYVQIFSRDDETLNQEDVNYFLQSSYHLSLGATACPDFSEEVLKMVLSSMVYFKNLITDYFQMTWYLFLYNVSFMVRVN